MKSVFWKFKYLKYWLYLKSQAFDKVWHPGLFCKLQKIIPQNLFKILKSYLSQRYYLVKEKQETTNILPILSGVPQGSVLGPVL